MARLGVAGLIFCIRCNCEIENLDAAWQRVTGWEKRRTQGGTNAIALRQPLQEFMCDICMVKERSGGASQERMF